MAPLASILKGMFQLSGNTGFLPWAVAANYCWVGVRRTTAMACPIDSVDSDMKKPPQESWAVCLVRDLRHLISFGFVRLGFGSFTTRGLSGSSDCTVPRL